MATFNSCQFIGRLGKNPNFTVNPSGTPIAKFSLAVDQGKNKEAMWLNVVAWDKLAEIIEKYASKGMQVFVQGRLQMRTYDDKSGTKRQTVELVATTVQLLDKRTTDAEAHNPSPDFDPFLDSEELP